MKQKKDSIQNYKWTGRNTAPLGPWKELHDTLPRPLVHCLFTGKQESVGILAGSDLQGHLSTQISRHVAVDCDS